MSPNQSRRRRRARIVAIVTNNNVSTNINNNTDNVAKSVTDRSLHITLPRMRHSARIVAGSRRLFDCTADRGLAF